MGHYMLVVEADTIAAERSCGERSEVLIITYNEVRIKSGYDFSEPFVIFLLPAKILRAFSTVAGMSTRLFL